MNVYSQCKYKYFTTSISVFLNMDKHCNPKRQCVYCHVKPAQMPDKGFCASCEEKGVPGSSYKFYPRKCNDCGKHHVNAALPPGSWDDYY